MKREGKSYANKPKSNSRTKKQREKDKGKKSRALRKNADRMDDKPRDQIPLTARGGGKKRQIPLQKTWHSLNRRMGRCRHRLGGRFGLHLLRRQRAIGKEEMTGKNQKCLWGGEMKCSTGYESTGSRNDKGEAFDERKQLTSFQ